jgi:hypothetical protein
MNEYGGSGSAINELSRSKSRYQHQDQLLLGFLRMPDSTAKEVAKEHFDWKYEKYADAPKRATDLASDKLQYLTMVGNRECRCTGKDAHTYRITERGIEHLRKVGLLTGSVSAAPVVSTAAPVGRSGLAGLRAGLV